MHATLLRPTKITSEFAPHTQSGLPPLALSRLATVREEAGHGVLKVSRLATSVRAPSAGGAVVRVLRSPRAIRTAGAAS